MKTPERKGGPKMPPKPKGGGAAARQKQFEMERGLRSGSPDAADADGQGDAGPDPPRDPPPPAEERRKQSR